MNGAIPTIPAGRHRTIQLQKSLLDRNATLAADNRELFQRHRVFAVNFVSGPGAGKTAIIGRLLDELGQRLRIGVIVGDLATDNDAQRLAGRSAPVLQITTGTLCHLDAGMVRKSLEQFRLEDLDLLIIENVGNLVCPAGFELGESLRVVVTATTEGEDKPVKYPVMFRTADVVLLNKMDLAEVAGFDLHQARRWIELAAPHALRFEMSARTGAGVAEWHEYLERRIHDSVAG
ncbi:MAG: hydrogenase nickel incorporation protein HypB [Gemmataceae bacterium]|nr:hydrogenase nickel incorporation protein HypB [Gemmataceae bacterium]